MSDTDDIENKIREMAKLTVLSNKINEIQEKNLKMFPLVYFNGVSSVKVEYDLAYMVSDKDASPVRANFVAYYLQVDETQDNSKLDVRFDYLERSVRNLFWNDLTVRVYFNQKKVCESK